MGHPTSARINMRLINRMICTQSCLCQTPPLFLSLSQQLIRAVLLEWTTTSKKTVFYQPAPFAPSLLIVDKCPHCLDLAWVSVWGWLPQAMRQSVHLYIKPTIIFLYGIWWKFLANSEVDSSPFSAPVQWRLLHDTLPHLRCASVWGFIFNDAFKMVVWSFGRKRFWIGSDWIRWKEQTERETGGCIHSHKDTCCIFCLQQNHNIISCCHLLSHHLFPHLNIITIFQSFIQVLTRSPLVPEKVTRSSTLLVLQEVAEWNLYTTTRINIASITQNIGCIETLPLPRWKFALISLTIFMLCCNKCIAYRLVKFEALVQRLAEKDRALLELLLAFCPKYLPESPAEPLESVPECCSKPSFLVP